MVLKYEERCVNIISMKKKSNIEKLNENKRSHKTLKIVLIIVLAAILLLCAAAVTVIRINKFTLDLTLVGKEEITMEYGDKYTEQGAESFFSGTLFMKEPIKCEVEVKGKVDTDKLGSYTVEYSSKYLLDYFIGEKEFTAFAKRTVTVVDTEAPMIELKSIEGHYTLPGHAYEEEGYTASDNYDGDITANVTSEEKEGKVYYSVTDSSGNKFEAVRDIFYDDPIPPEIKLMGDQDQVVIAVGGDYEDTGCTASDNIDGDLTDKVIAETDLNTEVPGEYSYTYTVSDSYDNVVTVTRPITVKKVEEIPKLEEGKEHEVLNTAPINPNGKIIYLTFDDGPGPHTERLLDVLKKYGIKATFFVVDTEYVDILPRMKEEGHTVAMHTSSHDYDTIYSRDEAYLDDLQDIEDRIKELVGEAPKILRFPGGGSNAISKKLNEGIMTRLTQKVKALGYRYFDWNVDSNDAGGTKSAQGVFDNVTDLVQNNRYSVVLQHDTKGYSVDAVEDIIIWGLKNGYTFLPLSERSPVCEHKVNN